MQVHKKSYSITIKILTTFLFCFLIQLYCKAQHPVGSEIKLTDSCKWEKMGPMKRSTLSNKTGVIFQRFGAIIIIIKGQAYNPCNLPSNLVGKKVLISGIIFKKIKSDGIPIKLTYLKILD
jgi:hypothetical protein